MLDPLKDVRLGRLPLAILACVSGAATALILAGGGGTDPAALAALAALRSGRTVVEQSAPTATGSTGAGSGSSGQAGAGSGSGSSAGTSPSAASSGSSGAGTSAGSSSTVGDTTPAASTNTNTTAPDAGLPHVGHVFLITLSTRSYAGAFGRHSKAPYLRTLTKRGSVLSGFHSLGSAELPDLLAMVSGQAPNRSTEGDCRRYIPFPASAAADSAGIVPGHGCVYPDTALTIADQTTSAGKTWGAYIADTGSTNCPVPNTDAWLSSPIGGTEEGYDLLHNPFAFFGSLLDAGGCSSNDESLTALPKALRRASTTPAFTYVGADACADGAPQMAPAQTTTTTTGTTPTGTTPTGTTPTGPTTTSTATTGTTDTGTPTTTTSTTTSTTTAAATTATTTPTTATTATSTPAAVGCPAGSQSGIAAENAFLKTWVPRIERSAAYRKNGVLVIAFTGDGGRRGARTGALVLSRWTPRGTTLKGSYGPYSLLHSLEEMLDYQPLAHAAAAPAFAKAVL